jgi:nitroimidazol reductase NimA-like FMN-containing flavoprotein (pyridoxamine 5'-phosphate oxidase superfamily)
MHESREEMEALQRLLDASYAAAGSHMLSIHTDDWRMSAQEVVDVLTGMCVLSLATVSSKAEPYIGPVDGQFYKGRFYCGSSWDSLRARHLRARPQVSVAHVRGEELAVVVHGVAREVDRSSEGAEGYREYLAEIYGSPMTDENWGSEGVVYWEIEPRKMFALAPKIGSPASS